MPRDYDLYGPDIFANPYPLYHKLRSDYPAHLDSHLGCWVITSYAGVSSGLANRDLSSERALQTSVMGTSEWTDVSPLFQAISHLMFYADPPKHTQIRALVSKALSARMVEAWRGHIQQIVDDQLDRVQAQCYMDVIKDLAFPLPARVIADMLGIPEGDRSQFKRWSDDLADFLGNPPTLTQCQHLLHSLQDFTAYFRGIVAEHRMHPKGDLVDALLQSETGENALTEEELLMNCVGLFTGGHETTTNAIGNGLLALLRHPTEFQNLRADPSLIEGAVEELLRYDSPVQFTARVAKQATEIEGKKIYKGQSVMLMLGAANRDPQRFHDPDVLDLRRQNNRHLAFGHNIHYCIGAPIARLELQIALNTLLQRMPNLHLANQEIEWQENLSFHGVKALQVTF